MYKYDKMNLIIILIIFYINYHKRRWHIYLSMSLIVMKLKISRNTLKIIHIIVMKSWLHKLF